MLQITGDKKELIEVRERILVFEVNRWVGVTEVGGDNKGQIVEMFQKSVDGKASGEAWCMSFIQFCLKKADELFDEITLSSNVPCGTFKSESVLQVWNNTPAEHRCQPHPGALMLWQFYKDGKPTGLGHAELVVGAVANGSVPTVGGNTGTGVGVQREGDGVYKRTRSIIGSPDMRVLGFIQPWV